MNFETLRQVLPFTDKLALTNYIKSTYGKKRAFSLAKKEPDTFWLAMLSSCFNDLASSQLLDFERNSLTDDCFWIYLSHDKIFFDSIIDMEMFRRRIINSIPLIGLDGYRFRFKQPQEGNILSLKTSPYGSFQEGNITCPTKNILSSKEEETFSNLLNVPLANRTEKIFQLDRYFLPLHITYPPSLKNYYALNRIPEHPTIGRNFLEKYYPAKIAQVCEEILGMGAVIAGGFVNSIVNPTYYLTELTIDTSRDKTSGDYVWSQVWHCLVSLEPSERSWVEIKDNYRDLCNCVRAYYSRFADRNKLTEEQCEICNSDLEIFKNYNLEEGLSKYREKLYLHEGKLYYLEFHYSHDVDIFVYGDNYLDIARRVNHLLYNNFSYMQYSKHYLYMIEYQSSASYIKFQLIKRAYSSIEEILAGFDLNSSRVALICEKGKFLPYCLQSYIDAVEYGINLVIPQYQSSLFNARLMKYYNRGFRPYFSGNILSRFRMTEEVSTSSEDDLKKYSSIQFNNLDVSSRVEYKHTFLELCLYKDKDVSWLDCESDYRISELDAEYPTILSSKEKINFFLHQRCPSIRNGLFPPTIKDIFFLSNIILEELRHCIINNREESGTPYITNLTSLIKLMNKLLICVSWKTVSPGSQLTGSFNPTYVNYLASTSNITNSKIISIREKEILSKTGLLINKYLPNSLVQVVDDYSGIYYDIFFTIDKIWNSIQRKENIYSDIATEIQDLITRL